MGFGYRYKPSKTKIREYAEKMDMIDDFCSKNNISRSANSDSYYFEINGQKYRVSNHSVESSNRGAYEEGTHEQIRELYHPEGREKDTIYIHAGKTRIMEIYENLKAGKELDGRGNIKERDEYER
mgnify:FL=1|jgi:hypothetical protein